MICSICYENIDDDDYNTHTLNECSHKFHTNCIIKWFRTESSQGKCPLCLVQQEKSEIVNELSHKMFWKGGQTNILVSEYLKKAKSLCNKSNKKLSTNEKKNLINKFNKLKELNNKLDLKKKERTDFNKRTEVKEYKLKQNKLWRDIYRIERSINKHKCNIVVSQYFDT